MNKKALLAAIGFFIWLCSMVAASFLPNSISQVIIPLIMIGVPFSVAVYFFIHFEVWKNF